MVTRIARALAGLALLASLAGCALPYKPLDGGSASQVGYTVEALGHNRYRIEYHAGAGASYPGLKRLLARYAQDLCQADYTLADAQEREFVSRTLSRAKPQRDRYVTAEMTCAKVDPVLMAASSITSLTDAPAGGR